MLVSQYTNLYTGNFLLVQRMANRLEQIGINPIIKDDWRSAQTTGFIGVGSPIQGLEELFVRNEEVKKAKPIVDAIIEEANKA